MGTASHLLGPHSSFLIPKSLVLSPQSLKPLKPKNPQKLKKWCFPNFGGQIGCRRVDFFHLTPVSIVWSRQKLNFIL